MRVATLFKRLLGLERELRGNGGTRAGVLSLAHSPPKSSWPDPLR